MYGKDSCKRFRKIQSMLSFWDYILKALGFEDVVLHYILKAKGNGTKERL